MDLFIKIRARSFNLLLAIEYLLLGYLNVLCLAFDSMVYYFFKIGMLAFSLVTQSCSVIVWQYVYVHIMLR